MVKFFFEKGKVTIIGESKRIALSSSSLISNPVTRVLIFKEIKENLSQAEEARQWLKENLNWDVSFPGNGELNVTKELQQIQQFEKAKRLPTIFGIRLKEVSKK